MPKTPTTPTTPGALASPVAEQPPAVLLLVHLGPAPFPPYLADCVRHVRRVEELWSESLIKTCQDALENRDGHPEGPSEVNRRCRIVLIHSQPVDAVVEPIDGVDEMVNAASVPQSPRTALFVKAHPRKNDLGGFWLWTALRFFVIHDYMAWKGLDRAVHIENDVLVYAPPAELATRFQRVYGPKLAFPMDNDTRAVAGIVWIGLREALGEYLSYAIGRLPYDPHEMASLGLWRSTSRSGIDMGGQLPIVVPEVRAMAPFTSPAGHTTPAPARYWEHANALGGVFDAAYLGQWLFGTDPRHRPPGMEDALGPGFVNESCLFVAGAHVALVWAQMDRLRIPFMRSTRRGAPWRPVLAIHFHCKDLSLGSWDRT